MRKAEKRRLGEERARVYKLEEQQRLQEQLKSANQIRAEKAKDKADRDRRKNAGKAIRNMKAGHLTVVVDNSSIEMECI